MLPERSALLTTYAIDRVARGLFVWPNPHPLESRDSFNFLNFEASKCIPGHGKNSSHTTRRIMTFIFFVLYKYIYLLTYLLGIKYAKADAVKAERR